MDDPALFMGLGGSSKQGQATAIKMLAFYWGSLRFAALQNHCSVIEGFGWVLGNLACAAKQLRMQSHSRRCTVKCSAHPEMVCRGEGTLVPRFCALSYSLKQSVCYKNCNVRKVL